ncbi:MAG: Pvc16 family protein [Leptolyngbyaceae bacterium]|nr:Pvc16 family protein [Leptolyngbyaceae bacterium]
MISAITQTLAEFLSRELSTIDTEQISFNHPMLTRSDNPGLNVYCYHVQIRKTNPPVQTNDPPPSQAWEMDHPLAVTLSPDFATPPNHAQWFDVSFLISVSDYTTLGEQYLLSEVLNILSSYDALPEEVLAPELKGQGSLPIQVSNNEWTETVRLWNVLCAPLRPALQVRITVPSQRPFPVPST